MIWAFGFAVIVLLYGLWFVVDECYGFLDRVLPFVATLFFTFLAFFAGFLFAAFIGIFFEKDWRETRTATLVSLRNGSSLEGGLVLGTGSIDSKEYYFFYKKIEGGFQPGKIEVGDNVNVFEVAGSEGTLKTYRRRFKRSWLTWIAVEGPSERHEFFIPTGSLRRGFSLQ